MENDYKNKDWLNNKYNIEKLSIGKIATLCNVGKNTIYYWLKKFKIQTNDKPKYKKKDGLSYNVRRKKTREYVIRKLGCKCKKCKESNYKALCIIAIKEGANSINNLINLYCKFPIDSYLTSIDNSLTDYILCCYNCWHKYSIDEIQNSDSNII